MRIIVASKNAHKVKELSRMLDIDGIELVSLKDMGFEGEIEEDGNTFEENAYIKAKAVCDMYNEPAIADDSGLCVDYLGGNPGIYSARFASSDGHNSDDAANVEKLLNELEGVPYEHRKAYFACAISLVFPDGRSVTVTGKCDGHITEKVCGNGGFGYDPVFYFDEFGKTFGETTDDEKNTVSHRYNAVKLIKEELLKII